MNLAIPLSIRANVRPLLALFFLAACMVMLLPATAAAATVGATQQRAIGDVVVPDGETASEVSTTVGDVTVNGAVQDDVEAGSGDVLLRGPVGGDVHATLGSVEVRAPVAGDVEAEVGDVRVYSDIEGDIDVGHGDVFLGPGAFVGGDVEIGNGNLLGNREAVQGNFTAGTASGLDRPSSDPDVDGSGVLGFFGWLLLTLIFVACAVLVSVLMPGTISSVARSIERAPGRSLLFGVISVPVAAVLGVVLAISVIGIPVLILLAPAYLAFVLFGGIAAAFFVGRKILLVTGNYRGGNALAAVVGAVAVSAVTLIPFIGDLVFWVLALIGAGAAIVALMNRRRPTSDYDYYYEPYSQARRGG